MVLRIMIGNIGTGKSLIAHKFAQRGEVIINMDSITRMIGGGEYGSYDSQKRDIYHSAEKVIIETALEQSFDVVIDRTNIDRKSRARFLQFGQKYSAEIIAYDFGAGDTDSLNRRISDSTISRSVWEKVHCSMSEAYEKPELDEGFSLIEQMPKYYKFYAFDFDGIIVENQFPNIGPIQKRYVDIMRNLEELSNIIIIWTCRSGEYEKVMRAFLLAEKIPFDFINENPILDYGSRKIFANEYFDDRNSNLPRGLPRGF